MKEERRNSGRNRKGKHLPFNEKYEVDPITECWNWTGVRRADGYGGIRIDGKGWLAHRRSWFLVNGPIPEGMCICHRCDNPSCVNPGHLFLGSHQDNMTDKVLKGRGRQAHILTEDDVRIIRSLKGKRSNGDLAAIYGVSSSTIYNVWRRKSGNT